MKHKFLSPIAGLLVGATMLMPVVGMAQTATTTATSTAQINAISSLLQQIQALQSQIDALKNSQKTLKTEVATQLGAFISNACVGSQGDEVKALQALLAANSNIYPEGLITGYFGKATEKALKKLQGENGLEQVGCVGPKTRALLNRLLGDHPIGFENENSTSSAKRLCAAVPPGHLVAPGWLKKNDGVRPIVPVCQTLPPGIMMKLGQGTTTPGNGNGNNLVPMINSITSTSTATTTAYVFWTTNKNTKSEFWYSTTSPLNTTTASKVVDNNFSMSHSVNLSGLNASTTYYYMIKVTDAANNSATSTERSLVTLSI
jgi:peptidoglycan hydrolase-like protein with peptidoglycan-binding domain